MLLPMTHAAGGAAAAAAAAAAGCVALRVAEVLMLHVMLLAAGGPGMVKAAYESGHPSIGVGAGNTPAVIDASADVAMAVSSILISKTFGEQLVITHDTAVLCVTLSSVTAWWRYRWGSFAVLMWRTRWLCSYLTPDAVAAHVLSTCQAVRCMYAHVAQLQS
jgi:hypothetical protein